MSKRPTEAEKAEREVDELETLAALTRASRRTAYKNVVANLRGRSPLDTIARVRLAIRPHRSRRPCDTGRGGTWYPDFTLNAFATALKEAERALRKAAPKGAA